MLSKPLSRALTPKEITLAKSVFGDALDYSAVRLKTAWWVLKGYGVAPNGAIYFNKADWCDDFGDETLGKRAWLIQIDPRLAISSGYGGVLAGIF